MYSSFFRYNIGDLVKDVQWNNGLYLILKRENEYITEEQFSYTSICEGDRTKQRHYITSQQYIKERIEVFKARKEYYPKQVEVRNIYVCYLIGAKKNPIWTIEENSLRK